MKKMLVRLGSCGKSWISAINPLAHESNFIEQNKLRDRACLVVILYIYIKKKKKKMYFAL